MKNEKKPIRNVKPGTILGGPGYEFANELRKKELADGLRSLKAKKSNPSKSK